MRGGGLAKTVSYVHGDSPKTEQAKALADWFEKLRQIIEAKPEYQRMPPIEGGYAWRLGGFASCDSARTDLCQWEPWL
jgi:hypothetical protein